MEQLSFHFQGIIGTDTAGFNLREDEEDHSVYISSESDCKRVHLQMDGGYAVHTVRKDNFTIGFYVGDLNEFLLALGISTDKIVEVHTIKKRN